MVVGISDCSSDCFVVGISDNTDIKNVVGKPEGAYEEIHVGSGVGVRVPTTDEWILDVSDGATVGE